ncbi:MAG: hypothetical protein ACOZE5_13690 [Verrucomicrobiota bacterium]
MNGALGWWIACLPGGRTEAWHSEYYGTVSCPLSAIGAAVLGYLHRTHPWRWPLAMALGQATAFFTSGPIANLPPFGLVAFVVLSLLLLVPAILGARLRRWRDGG